MRKTINTLGIITSLMLAFTALTLTTCDLSIEETHNHSYDSGWTFNDYQHWKECECGEKIDIYDHNGSPCEACGYNNNHTHSYDSGWTFNDYQHWKECECGDKIDIYDHHGYSSCEACGYDGHIHSYDSGWTFNNDQHWKECECGEKIDINYHYGNNSCGACGYDGHIHRNSYSQYNDYQHWFECLCGEKRYIQDHVGNPCGCGFIKKKPGAVVGSPTLNSCIPGVSIIVNAVEAPDNGQIVEYTISTTNTAPSSSSNEWQDFTNLNRFSHGILDYGKYFNNTYYIFARSKENDWYFEGPASTGLEVKTKSEGAKVKPTLIAVTHNSITINAVPASDNGQTVEYSIIESEKRYTTPDSEFHWQDSTTFSGLTVNTTYFIFARSKENVTFYAGEYTEGYYITDSRIPGAAVNTPTLNTKTTNSITINSVSAPSNGQTVEYGINTINNAMSIDGLRWQDSTTFSGLSGNTTYYIFARSKENTYYNTGTASSGLQVTTDKYAGWAVDAPILSAKTNNSITIYAVPAPSTGQTVEYAINTTNTAPSTNWQDSRTFSGLTANTTYYIFARSKENDSWYAGTASTSLQVTTNKMTGATVTSPTLDTKTYNSITICAVSAPGNGQTVEYARNSSNTAPSSGWQDSTTFPNLTVNTTYYIFARSKEDTAYYAGTASTDLRVTTNKMTGATVSSPTSYIKTHNSITINAVSAPGNGQTVEYAINTTNTAPSTDWQDSTTFINLITNTTYYVFARSNENNSYYTGTASTGLQVITHVYKIGDTGPAGGIIYYYNPTGFEVKGYGKLGDTGYFATYTAYYLEAAPTNEGSSIRFGPEQIQITDAYIQSLDSMSLIGNGRKSTQTAVFFLDRYYTGTAIRTAAQVCASKELNGFTDWFLPSLGELNEMYKTKEQNNITSNEWFWSSSEYDWLHAWVQPFNGAPQQYMFKNNDAAVRAIRAF